MVKNITRFGLTIKFLKRKFGPFQNILKRSVTFNLGYYM